MIRALPSSGVGISAAVSLPDLTDRSNPGSEDLLMENRISGRSLQDDAFGAEESVNRRSRVMGEEFADHHLEESPGDSRQASDESESEADPTEDPVRMYLMQMGQIPLLTRDQEVSAAKQIEKTRDKYRHCMLATDFMLQGALKLLQQVRDKQLRLDRTIEVSVTNAVEKKAIMQRIVPNVRTLEHLLDLNRIDYFKAINKRLPMRQRRAAWKNLVVRRNKAVRLVEEMNLRTGKLQPLFEKLQKGLGKDGRNSQPTLRRTESRSAGHAHRQRTAKRAELSDAVDL